MRKSAYIDIYERIKEKIVSGDYKYNEKLPSKRSTALNESVSVITVQNAYALLCEEGYVEAKERSGYFVIYKASDFIGELSRDKEKGKEESGTTGDRHSITHHSKGDFSFGVLTRTARKVMLDYGERILEKAPNAGCIEFREAIRGYLATSRGIHVGIDQIVVGAGAEYLYGLVAQLFDSDAEIAVENPCYDKIRKVYTSLGHRVDSLDMNKDGILTSELLRTGAKVLHVTPFHSYPSNITAGISKKQDYLRWAGSDKYIVEDNYDSELTVSGKLEDTLFTLSGGKRVIYINTFSKTVAPSIRVGYMILPEELVEVFREKLGFYSCTVPVLEQYILCELLKNGDYQRHLNRVRRRLRNQK